MEFLAEAAQLARIERFGLDSEDFGRALQQSAERYAPGAQGRALREFLLGLRLEDLALATACACGIEAAWEEFHQTYRQYLVDAAGDAELADAIIAELYGVGAREGRQGRIADFRGRSSLKGWLRAIVYQAEVDRHRRESRLTELDPDCLPEAARPEREERLEDFERRENAAALARALGREIDALDPAGRLVLGWYYQDRLRLNQIARLRGVHESTISRELDAIRRRLRKRVEKGLRAEGFSAARIEECFRYSGDAPVDLDELLPPTDRLGGADGAGQLLPAGGAAALDTADPAGRVNAAGAASRDEPAAQRAGNAGVRDAG